MNAQQLTELMASLEIQDAELAALVGVDRTAVVRWRTGARQMPPPVKILVRLLEKGVVTKHRLKVLAAGG